MKTEFKAVPREFSPTEGLTLQDMGDVMLGINEQVTFRTESGKPNDVTRMSWGYYLSNSVNRSAKKNGFKTALVVSRMTPAPRLFINLVEQDKLAEYAAYLESNQSEVVVWLDEWFGGRG